MMVLFTWKRKLAWAAAFINFPFLFSPTTCLSWHGEGPFWAQQVVLCAWHHLKLVQVSGGLFAALPLRMFADPKKQLCLTRFFSCLRRALFSLTFSFFFFSSWKNINWNKGKFQKTNTGFIQYGNLYSSYISYTNNPNVKSQSAYSICTSKEIQIRKWCLQSRIVKLLNITDMTASPCTKVLISFRFSAPSPSIFLSWVYWEWRGSLVKYIPYRMSFAPSCCRMRRNSFFSGCLHMRWLAWDYISKVFVRACSMLQWVGGNRWVCPCKNRVNMVRLKWALWDLQSILPYPLKPRA